MGHISQFVRLVNWVTALLQSGPSNWLWQRKSTSQKELSGRERLREKGRVEEWRGRRVQVCLAQISTTLGVVCCSFKAYQLSWGIGFRLKEQHQLIICMEIIPCLLSITLSLSSSLSLSVPPASTKCQLYKFKLNHSIVKQCAAHTRSQQRVKLYNLILPFSSFSFPFSFGWGKNWSKNKTSAPLNSFRRF